MMRNIAWMVAIMTLVPRLTSAATPINKCGAVISAPGSYVLTKNLMGAAGQQSCITVNSNYVTIDLGGFTINCNSNGGGRGYGIGETNHTGVTGAIVRNGQLIGCNVGLLLADSTGVLVDGVSASKNDEGIWVGGGSTVLNSIGNDNSPFHGISFLNCPSNALNDIAVANAGQNLTRPDNRCILFNTLAP
jgi:hypothetical protein